MTDDINWKNIKDVNWKNIENKLCIMCSADVKALNYFICKKCNKLCLITRTKVSQLNSDEVLMDVKSVCCKSDVEFYNKITCSEYCHEEFVLNRIKKDGEFKKVTDHTGMSYKVPVRKIIEEGVLAKDLKKNYPRWDIEINHKSS